MKRLLFVLGLLLLIPSEAFAVRQFITLSNLSAQTADVTGSKVCLPSGSSHISFSGDVTFNSGTSTLDGKIQYTIDEGTTWVDFAEGVFTQVTTSSDVEVRHIAADKNLQSFGCFRVVVDVGSSGSPNYDWVYKVHFTRD